MKSKQYINKENLVVKVKFNRDEQYLVMYLAGKHYKGDVSKFIKEQIMSLIEEEFKEEIQADLGAIQRIED